MNVNFSFEIKWVLNKCVTFFLKIYSDYVDFKVDLPIILYTGLHWTQEEIFQVLSVIMTGTGDFIVHLYSRIN